LGQEGQAQRAAQAAQEKRTRASTQRRDMGVVQRGGRYEVIYTKTPEALALADRLNKEEGRNKPAKPTPAKPPATTPTAARTPAGSGSTPPPRPAARPSGPVLSKKDGVEGTGVGADFKEKAFSSAEKSRYASVAAQNAARTSASSGTPKPSSPTPAASAPKPAIGMLGKTSFERRTPTSAELRAAQGERERQKTAGENTSTKQNSEKALQAAQKTNLPTTGPTPAIPDLKSVSADLARANTPANLNRAPAGSAAANALAAKPATSTPTPSQIAGASQGIKPATPGSNSINNTKTKPIQMNQSYQWPSAKTIRDIAGAYSSIYEAKKKVDQDEGETNRWWDDDGDGVGYEKGEVSGKFKKKKKKVTKEEVELWVNELIEEGYDLSDYTWDEMSEIYLDEATRMRKELGQEGEIATRKELARRSNAYQRSGSVDKTIAAAERGAKSPYVKPVRGESDADTAARERKQSKTLSDLAASRRSSVRDKPRAGLRGYGADVTGSDRELQNSRRSAMAAGTLTPREQKMLNKEAYETYEFVASYLLENNFAESVEDANVIINNMSEGWFDQIIEGAAGDVAARAQKLANQKKRQTPERKKMYQDLADKAAARERGPFQGGDTRTGMTASDRERRRESGAYHDSVFGDGTRTYGEGGVTKNPKKLAQQKARGQHAEG